MRVVNHIKTTRMRNYIHLRVEITPKEEAHLSECAECLKLFRICLLSEASDKLERETIRLEGARRRMTEHEI